MKHLYKSTAVALALLCVSFATPGYAAKTETYNQLNLFADVFERIRSNYVKDVDDEELLPPEAGPLTALVGDDNADQ